MAKRSRGLRLAQQARFLEAFAQCGVVLRAAELSGVDDSTHYRWLEKDAAYAEGFKLAEERATQVLELELRRRATGYSDVLTYQGQVTGTVTRYSDLLLIFLLKSKRPERYRDNWQMNVSGTVDHHHTVTVVHELHDTPPAVMPAPNQPPLLPPVEGEIAEDD